MVSTAAACRVANGQQEGYQCVLRTLERGSPALIRLPLPQTVALEYLWFSDVNFPEAGENSANHSIAADAHEGKCSLAGFSQTV